MKLRSTLWVWLVVEFGEQGKDEAQAGIGIGEDAVDAGAPAQFPVDAF